ncbi:MAG: hypothetical protein LBL99_01135 [Holosporaceae bacterium]|jgi:DNA-binding transcriptional ArsR family regulator|nr:hypothetical protein [Holosporaceae bacterium]
MKKLVFLFVFLFLDVKAIPAAEGVMAMSAAASLKTLTEDKKKSIFGDFFSPKGGLILEEVMLSIDENMNDRGAVKVHLVVVYEHELVEELMKMSSDEYFRGVDQMIKDYPDKMKIFEWELVAKKRVMPWKKVEYPTDHMIPLAGFVFAKYSSSGKHRATIPPSYKKVKITFEKKNFRVDYEDKDKDK